MRRASLRTLGAPDVSKLSSSVDKDIRKFAKLSISECRVHDAALSLMLLVYRHMGRPSMQDPRAKAVGLTFCRKNAVSQKLRETNAGHMRLLVHRGCVENVV